MDSRYRSVLELVRKTGRVFSEVEVEVLGCTHAEVAAYLLGSWGLPEAVIEGVTWHLDPAGSNLPGFSTALATHLAAFFHEERAPFWMKDGIVLNRDFLAHNGLADREEAWRQVVADVEVRPAR
jgi:hypothetical protein